jgi:CDP-diacylglycerol---serine O-phosphatidyltransferase
MAKKAGQDSSAQDGGSQVDVNQTKQAMYLAQDTGHFSLIKAMHLADLITLGNGLCGCTCTACVLRE